MNTELRENHIDFIEKDTGQRGESIVSDIQFFGAIYSCRVKKDGEKRSKSVSYSAASSVMSGYRKITLTNQPTN